MQWVRRRWVLPALLALSVVGCSSPKPQSFCHGIGVIAGPLPDLRYATAEVHGQFEAIVRGGARAPLGMPAFADRLTSEQVHAVEAYVLSRAAAASAASRAPQ